MKHIYLFILAMLPMIGLTACSDDNDIPAVSVSVDVEGATRVGNTLYVVRGEPLDITAINLEDNTPKGAVIGGVTYFWDYYRIGATITQPYAMTIDTEGVPVGNHLLQIEASVYAVDYAPCTALVSYKVAIVENASDIPTSGDVETNPSLAATIHEQK